MKYSINIYKDGEFKEFGTDFVSTNTFIKCLDAFKKLEKCVDPIIVLDTLADVCALIFPSLTKDEIKDGADIEELLRVVNNIVAKLSNINQSKNV